MRPHYYPSLCLALSGTARRDARRRSTATTTTATKHVGGGGGDGGAPPHCQRNRVATASRLSARWDGEARALAGLRVDGGRRVDALPARWRRVARVRPGRDAHLLLVRASV